MVPVRLPSSTSIATTTMMSMYHKNRATTTTASVLITSGCCFFLVQSFSSSSSSQLPPPSATTISLIDILRNAGDDTDSSPRLLNGLGIQLLVYSGWQYDETSGVWKKPNETHRPKNVQERLAWITPTWKGGSLDYASILSNSNPNFV